ncbi:hypothetical protein [Nocardia jejuensis]|uniref:hypothetical protein n=1 Tax=Nocardia jejuensis TaxID=328049 RepID=UPI00082E9860|nr:hypothetical protein [Nocardia jejuensis]
MTGGEVELIVVDAANVVGSRPDGWWKDRPGAARRLLDKLPRLHTTLGRPVEILVVLEGAAKAAVSDGEEFEGIRLVSAERSGDDAIVDVVAAAADGSRHITVVTADRGLRERVEAHRAETVGPRWLLDLID